MTQNVELAIAALLLLGIAVVFVSPVLDLQPTTVRTPRPAALLVSPLWAANLGVWDTSVSSYPRFTAFLHTIPTGSGSPVDLNCIRLC